MKWREDRVSHENVETLTLTLESEDLKLKLKLKKKMMIEDGERSE